MPTMCQAVIDTKDTAVNKIGKVWTTSESTTASIRKPSTGYL